MHEDINKIASGPFVAMKDVRYRVQVINEDTGEIVYSRASDGGIFTSVESHRILKEEGAIDGNIQFFGFGRPTAIMYAHMQAKDRMKQITQEPLFREEIQRSLGI